MPKDSFDREIDYLRISVTDRCNLRCVYCMPLEGLRFLPGSEMLNAAEIEQVVRAAVAVGFRKFRLTGGEPTLRADLLEIVERIAAVPGVRDLALTTNAILMTKLARPLRDAGLGRINVHLDSLNPKTVEQQMRWGRFEEIWRGIMACRGSRAHADQTQRRGGGGLQRRRGRGPGAADDRARLARAVYRADAAGRRRVRAAFDSALRLEYRDPAANRARARAADADSKRAIPVTRRATINSPARAAWWDSSAR